MGKKITRTEVNEFNLLIELEEPMDQFFRDVFGIAPCSAQYRAEVEKLTAELIRIGETDDFLSERPVAPFNLQCRHNRARQIGQRLNEIGGLPLMEFVHRRTKRKLGSNLAAHLEYCWVEIGQWLP